MSPGIRADASTSPQRPPLTLLGLTYEKGHDSRVQPEGGGLGAGPGFGPLATQKVTLMGALNFGPQRLQYCWFLGTSGESGQSG